jgi:transposase
LVALRGRQGDLKSKNRYFEVPINGIEGFWSYAKNWLYPYRSVPTKFFHLYLAEVCWRFNHRDEDLKPLLKRLLTTLSTSEINPILVRKA